MNPGCHKRIENEEQQQDPVDRIRNEENRSRNAGPEEVFDDQIEREEKYCPDDPEPEPMILDRLALPEHSQGLLMDRS